MSQLKPTDAEKAAHAHRDGKVDKAIEDTFPASDPPSTTPPPGTRKAEQMEAAEKAKTGKALIEASE
jgi:hypothetical protein